MPNDKIQKPTPIPPAVQAKVQQGVRQRYAMATAGSVGAPKEPKR